MLYKNELTKQLYEGTLPTGLYYFYNEGNDKSYIKKYHNIKGFVHPEGLIVLGKVPSFEEYEELKNELESAICELAGEDW